jgi:ubiquinone biosynthesis protein COQ4
MAAPRPRIRPLAAWRAVRALLRNPDDTKRVFDVIDALAGRNGERQFERFRATPSGARILAEKRDLLATLSDRERLLAMPAGSLGRTYAEFMGREQISPEGLVAASMEGGRGPDLTLPAERRLMGARMRDQHDLWHVVTGYGRDLVGEAAVLAFTYAQTRNRGIGLIVAVAYWRGGKAASWFRPLIREAWRRGRRAAWLPATDWEAMLPRPLHEVREELGLGEPPRYEALRSAGAPALAA